MNLILTLDYELFGDGSGNIYKHMITPTSKILGLCKKYDIKITIFVEILEYIAISKAWNNGATMGYSENPIKAIDSQIKNAYLDGNDVQLHFHPQWIGAKFIENKWNVNMDNWRLGDFKSRLNYNTLDLFRDAINSLKKIVNKVDESYSPKIIRAGGYNILPSSSVLKAMKQNSIIADSSVYPGGYENGDLSVYDYRNLPTDRDYWFVQNEFNVPSSNFYDVIELPIFALPQRRWRKYGKERIKSILINKKSAMKTLNQKTKKKKIIEKLTYFTKKESLIWDFCTFSPRMHKRFFEYVEKFLMQKRKNYILIGHPKNFSSEETFHFFLETAIKKDFKFITLLDFLRSIPI